MPEADKPVDATRGTAIWAINRLRSDLLPALLGDLAKHESGGLERGQCMRVAKTLAQLAESATALSARDSDWTKALHGDLTAFQEIFVAHNMDLTNQDDAIGNRIVTLAQLRTIRQKLSDRIRRNLSTIERELDIGALEAMVSPMRDLAAEFPEALSQLSSAIRRFHAGIGEQRRPG